MRGAEAHHQATPTSRKTGEKWGTPTVGSDASLQFV